MKYIISANKHTSYKNVSIEDCKRAMHKGGILFCDTETTGLYPTIHEILTFQFKCSVGSFLIDCTTIDIKEFKEELETLTIVFHNAKFDIGVLYAQGIWPYRNVHCTYIREKVITSGFKKPASLSYLVKIHCGKTLNKSQRKNISKDIVYKESFLEYCFEDVEYMSTIFYKQNKSLKELELETTYEFERLFIPALAYVERCGFKLNIEKWIDKIKINEAEVQQALDVLSKLAKDSGFCPNILFDYCDIDWNSPKVAGRIFKEKLGLDISIEDKKTGLRKDSVEAKHMQRYEKIPLVAAYINYKSKMTLLNSFGQNYLNLANTFPDKRIRTSFSQLAVTGRMTGAETNESFGKKKDKANLQNVPKIVKAEGDDPGNEYRSERLCFEPNEGNTFVVADYSQQEQVIMANQSEDPKLLEFFMSGGGDMHCHVARAMYPELEGMSDKEVKQKAPGKRQTAKNGGFCLNYNGAIPTLARNLGLTIEKATEVFNTYFGAFPGLKQEFERRKKYVVNHGYVLTNNVTKRKIFFDLDEINREYRNADWERYKAGKLLAANEERDNKNGDKAYFLKLRALFKKKGNIDNSAVNFPTQSTAADCTKLSVIKFFHWIRKNNLLDIVLIPNIVHDEVVGECPISMAERVSKVLQYDMEESSKPFCTHIKIKSEPKITIVWDH